jgi:class 3 adenylate cyclase
MTLAIGQETEVRAERLVLALTHVNGATAACAAHGDAAALAAIRDGYALWAAAAARAGGEVVKGLGDGVLMAFPPERARDAVDAVREARVAVEARWRRLDDRCRAEAKLGLGTVLRGAFGPPGDPREDLYGDALNRLFKPPWGEMVVTEELEKEIG